MSSSELTNFFELDGHQQADRVRRGDVPTDFPLRSAEQRIKALNPKLNAVCHLDMERAIDRLKQIDPESPMAFVPYLLKASFEYPGLPHTSGSRSRCEMIGSERSAMAEQFDASGLVLCGSTTMPEFGLIGTGEALLYGPTRNPWDTLRTAGGSSSGSAVAVATGMVPFATGSDGGGSIRIPAAHCGVIGFKPSRGWNLRARPPALIDDLLTSDGLLARSMRDAIWSAQYLRKQPPANASRVQPLRIAINLLGLDGLPPDRSIADAILDTADLCQELGYDLSDVKLPLNYEKLSKAFSILWAYGAGEVVDMYQARLSGTPEAHLEPWTLGLAAMRKDITPAELANAFSTIAEIELNMASFWVEWDLVLSPVTATLPPPIGILAPDREFKALWSDHFRHVNYTQLQNMAGYPGISLPLYQTAQGLPIGSMFWGPAGSDDLLLSIGATLEAARNWQSYQFPS